MLKATILLSFPKGFFHLFIKMIAEIIHLQNLTLETMISYKQNNKDNRTMKENKHYYHGMVNSHK